MFSIKLKYDEVILIFINLGGGVKIGKKFENIIFGIKYGICLRNNRFWDVVCIDFVFLY